MMGFGKQSAIDREYSAALIQSYANIRAFAEQGGLSEADYEAARDEARKRLDQWRFDRYREHGITE